MPTDRFFIAPFEGNSGLQKDRKPFMIMDQAFDELNNAYCWRGRIRKRFGSRWFGENQQSSRLRINVGTTNGAGALAAIVPGASGAIGQLFSIGADNLFTVWQANGSMLIDGTAATATFNTATGAFSFTGTDALTVVYWYPALPVMGLATFENAAVNNEPLIAFDTRFSYEYASTGWERLALETNAGDATWTGSDSQFFWFTTYTGVNASDYALFVTNFNELEPNFMRYLFGYPTGTWNTFRPQLNSAGTLFLNSARILIPFKNRMLAFNVWEGTDAALPAPQVQYAFRMRYSAIGSPIDNAGATYFPWAQDVPAPNGGGGRDCPTLEAIVTVQFVKDRLIVFCEESTWEIVYTGNQQSPFVWQQINSELGAESTFSVVPFDKVAIGVGNVGVVACTGTNVDRIDDKIPDEVFKIHNDNDGPERVYGIRDYTTEMIYWTFPSMLANTDFPFPSKVLVYNYKNGTWSFNDDSITAFGYYQPITGITWSSTTVEWEDEIGWSSGSIQGLFRQVVAGNQQGWVFIVDPDETQNELVLQITNITIPVPGSNNLVITAINHNLRSGDYVYFDDVTSNDNLDFLNNEIFLVRASVPENPNTFQITFTDTLGTILAGTYFGGGTLARVSNIQIKTKQYNFYMNEDRNAYVSKVDFLVDKTEFGQIQVDFYISTSELSMIDESNVAGTGSLLGTSILETYPYTTVPFESSARQLWHPLYFQADGEFIQLNMQLNDAQMRNRLVRGAGFQLHAMTFFVTKTASRSQ
jgi:hypothetical protein